MQFVIGPVNSGEALATTPILARAGVPNIVIGALDELVDPAKYPRAFRAINTNLQWISTANNYATGTLKKTKVAIIADTSGYGTASARSAEQLLDKAGISCYVVLVDPNKTDLSDEMNKAKAAGADVVMPWSAATGLLGRLLNARGDMGWNVPVVGHPALMAAQIRKLLNKPEYWDNTFAAGYRAPPTVPTASFRNGRRRWSTRCAASSAAARSTPVLVGRARLRHRQDHRARGQDRRLLDPAAIQKVLENTKFRGVYTSYSWSPTERNGFPDANMAMNAASTFKDGSFKPAPR